MEMTWIGAARRAQEVVEILEAGAYEVDGRTVDITDMLRTAVEGTVAYPPDVELAWDPPARAAMHVDVKNVPTLQAARRLVERGLTPMVLNFASAVDPGGRFLQGALAQEEYLARSSGLYACIRGHEFYTHHRASGDPRYSHYAIYSPGVPVLRDDRGDALVPEPYRCAMLTCAAVLASELPGRREELRALMGARIERVLRIAGLHGHDALVLGAWGCGAFGNEPADIAGLFADALRGPFDGAFDEVVFAVWDTTRTQRFYRPFEQALAPQLPAQK